MSSDQSAIGRWIRVASLATILLVLIVFLFAFPFVRELQIKLNDTYTRLAPRPKRSSQIVLVLIDDRSLQQYGRWPWSRVLLAQLLRNVGQAQPSVMGLDILLSEPQSPAADHELSEAMRSNGRTVNVDMIANFPEGPRWIEPIPEVSQASLAVGHALAVLDSDGVCRHFPPRELTTAGVRSSFSVELARHIDAQRTGLFLRHYGITPSDDLSPVTIIKPVLIPIRYRNDGFETISAADVLENHGLEGLAGRQVLIGFSPAQIGDRLSTPLSGELPASGIEVHAQILDNILSSNELHEAPLWVALASLLIFCPLLVIVFLRCHGWAAVALLAGLIACIYLAGYLLFAVAFYLIASGPLLLAAMIAPLLTYTADFVAVERGMAIQLRGLERWLATRKIGDLRPRSADLPWKLRALEGLQNELGSLYELHHALLEATHDAVGIFNERGRLILCNRRFESLLATRDSDPSLEEIRGQLAQERGAPATEDASAGEGEAYLKTELYSFRMVPLPITNLSPAGGTILTLTSLRLRAERDRARAEALGFVTHELRTPLVSIQGFAEVLLRYPSSPASTKAPEIIFRESKRLLALINTYLDVLRLDGGARTLRAESVPIGQIVREVFDVLQPIASPSGSRLMFTDSRELSVTGDRVLLTGAILNLVSNAIKYGKQNAEIHVRCTPDEDGVLIAVENEGEPISEQDLPRLFDPHFRAQSVEVSVPGWGLGLTFVKRIVESHGGSVRVKNDGDKTTFEVRIPGSKNAVVASV